jgi:hypothetical protein
MATGNWAPLLGVGIGAAVDKRNRVRGGIIGGLLGGVAVFVFPGIFLQGVSSGVVSPGTQYLPEVKRLV